MSKFDAAIRTLKSQRKYAMNNCYGEQYVQSLEAAIRVLEAAGKVDKKTVSVVLGDVRTLLARENRTAFIWAIKAALDLLAALPEEEK